jgi:HK97 family phage prohead protease
MDETDGKRTFKGIATTPTPDRVGDIVEPKGAEFKLPVPLLWQHNAREPIGWVRAARITDKGIEVDCEIASVSEEGKLKERLDEAWQSLKAKLVGGLSIGFKPLESARIGDSYSYRFMKWLWLELSAVTVPANGDCSITAIKSADEAARRAALGAQARSRVVRLDNAGTPGNAPGASGQPSTRRKGVVYLN